MCSLRIKAGLLIVALTASTTLFGETPTDQQEPEVPVARDFPVQFPWGTLTADRDSVQLRVTAIPKDRVVKFPRFNNSYKRVYLKGDPERAPLKFVPEVTEWQVTLPSSVKEPAIVIIETAGHPRLITKPFVHQPDDRGGYLFPAHNAIVHGEKLRFEPQPHKNTVGYWAVESDWCEWKVHAPKPGKFAVHILQGCGKGHGGSEVEMSIGDSRLLFEVEDTGHFQNFKDRMVGTLAITKAGEHYLRIHAKRKAKIAIMDVREVRLAPVTD